MIPYVAKCIFSIEKYLQIVNLTLARTYCNNGGENNFAIGLINLNTSVFKNNLNTENWYYGDSSPTKYRVYMFNRTIQYNLTDCPIGQPFTDDTGKSCFNCIGPALFNLGTM